MLDPASTEYNPNRLYDKTGRQIMVGDVLKVFHFVGARWRKHYFMFKQVTAECTLGASETRYLFVNHLEMKETGYYEQLDGRLLRDVEIVQGCGENDWFHDRPKVKVPHD